MRQCMIWSASYNSLKLARYGKPARVPIRSPIGFVKHESQIKTHPVEMQKGFIVKVGCRAVLPIRVEY